MTRIITHTSSLRVREKYQSIGESTCITYYHHYHSTHISSSRVREGFQTIGESTAQIHLLAAKATEIFNVLVRLGVWWVCVCVGAQQAARSGKETVAPVAEVQARNKKYEDEADYGYIFNINDDEDEMCGTTGGEASVSKSYRGIKLRLGPDISCLVYVDTGATGCYVTGKRIAWIRANFPDAIVSIEKDDENGTSRTYDASGNVMKKLGTVTLNQQLETVDGRIVTLPGPGHWLEQAEAGHGQALHHQLQRIRAERSGRVLPVATG